MPYKDRQKQLEYQKKHYRDNIKDYKDRNFRRRKERWTWFYSVTSDICCRACGESERICLDFHHIDPKTKDACVTKLLNDLRSKKRVLAEVKKCVVFCSNCHRKFHAGIIKL